MKNHSRLISPADRNGVAIILVLGVIAITMAMSYALLRTQFAIVEINENSIRQGDARQAAVVGISRAIRVMHDADTWEGVNSTIEGQLSSTLRYEVTYTAGDPSLDPANRAAYPNREYDKYATRVTLDSIGYAVDPDDSSRETSHHIRAVMQLVPRKLSTAEPAKWAAINQYTVYQWDADKQVDVELPARVEGAAYMQGALKLAEQYPYDAKPFDGAIDEVAIFGYALSTAQLQYIYSQATSAPSGNSDRLGSAYTAFGPSRWWRMNEATGTTTMVDSVGGKNGTFEGVHNRVGGAPGTSGGAAEFRGRHDAVNLGNLEITSSNVTICGWFKADSFDGHEEARIISKATSTDENDHYWMLSTVKQNGAMRLRFRLKTTLGSTTTLTGTGGSFSAGQWVFATAVYDGLFMRLYQNGVQVGSTLKLGAINTNNYVQAFIGDNPPGSSRAKYLTDLERMRADGVGDFRPFTGPLSLGENRTDDSTQSLLRDELSTTVDATITSSTASPLTHPGSVTEYQLYTGGPVYSVPRLPSTLSGQTIEPDPVNNPLGVYRDSGQDTSVYENTSIHGVLIFDDNSTDIKVKGGNVSFLPVELPALDNGTVYELPVVLTEGDFKVEANGGGSIHGMVVAWDKMCLEPGANQTLSVAGRVVTRELSLKGPAQWAQISAANWNLFAYYFRIWNDYFASSITANYFPQLLSEWMGYDYTQRVTVKPDDSAPNYYWHDWQNPIIVPHPDDPGLRWDLVQWTDNPLTNE